MNTPTAKNGPLDDVLQEEEYVTEQYGTANAWIKKLQEEAREKNMRLLLEKVKQSIRTLPRIVGKTPTGQSCHLYGEQQLREACKTLFLPMIKEDGTVMMEDGRLAVGLAAYANSFDPKYALETMNAHVTAGNLKPVPDIKAYNVLRPVDVYWKDEVDAVLPKRLSKGVVDINGRLAIGTNAYAGITEVTPTTLLKLISEVGLDPVPNVEVYSRTQSIPVYWKDEVDKLIPKRVDKNGIVSINGRDAVAITQYARSQARKMAPGTLSNLITNANKQPVSGVNVLSGNLPVDVYWKDEVDALLPKYLEKGVVNINGKLAVGVSPYSNHLVPKMSRETLYKLIEEADVKPIPSITAFSGPQEIELYWKDEVDALIPKVLEGGVVMIHGRAAVGLNAYKNTIGLKIGDQKLKQCISGAGLVPVPDVPVYSVRTSVVVYWKDEVDAVLRKHGYVD